MKVSAEVMKTLRGRRHWREAHAALAQRERQVSLALADYIEMMRPTAQALTEAVCALDLAGRIQFANPLFQRMLARSEEELQGERICDFGFCASTLAQDGVITTSAGLRAALEQRATQEFGACEWIRPDGAHIRSRCAVRPINRAGQTVGMTLIARQSDAGSLVDTDTNDALQSAALREVAHVERRLRVVETVGDIALAQLSPDALLQALLDGMRREMRLENIAILLTNEQGDLVTARAASGAGASIAESVRVPIGQGIVGEAMRARRPIVIANERQLAERAAHFTPALRASMKLQSLVMVPLVVDDHSIGVMFVGSSEPDHFSQEDVWLVELVGERAALVIERARANDEAARAHQRLHILNDASDALNATLDYHVTTQRLASILTPALGDACAIYLLEDDGLLRKVATQTPTPDALPLGALDHGLRRLIERMPETVEAQPDDTSGAIGRCVQTLSPIFERQPLMDADTTAETLSECVCVPLVVRQHALGALYLAMRPGKRIAAGDLTLIQGLAERAAVAIDNARLYSETEQALASGSAMATQLDTIFDATDVGIIVTDAAGDYLRINPYGAQMLGLAHEVTDRADRARASDAPPFTLRTPEGEALPAERDPLRLARVQGRPIEQRLVIHRRADGKDVQALIRCTPWLDMQRHIAGAIGVFTDITAISELERQKDVFLGIASHELKTPLTTLKILAQLLARKMSASDDSRELEYAQRMQVSITRMERLIHDLLDVSLIHEGKLALSQHLTDLGALCAEATHEQRALSERVIRYSAPQEDLTVYADRERIYQVLTNLLSNALKYSPETTAVDVWAGAVAGECVVSVHDHGPGVPPEALDHIFDRFFRVPGMQVQSGSGVGLGLGLSICKDIISRHGGRIWIESKLGHGSVFSFALPQARQGTPFTTLPVTGADAAQPA